MAAKVAQLLTLGSFRYGKDLKANGATIEPGMLVKLDTGGSTVSTSGSAAADAPIGMAFGHRYQPYTPTTKVFADGEPLTVIYGQGMALLSVDFFDEGSLPAALATVYASASGKWTANVTANVVGKCIGTRTRMEPVGGVGASQNLALVKFNFE